MKSLVRAMITAAALSAAVSGFAADAVFSALPMCGKVKGAAEVKVPHSSQWQAVQESKYYPLGSDFRSVGADSSLEVFLGEKSVVRITGEASFGVEIRPIGDKTRSLKLYSGVLELDLPRNLPEGVFTLSARGFTVKNPAGEARFVCLQTGDGDSTTVRCVTGTMALSGLHFEIPAMRAADELVIRTSHDLLYTGLNCTSGDFAVKLDQGMVPEIKNIETGEMGETKKTLEWKLSPKCAVRIHRSVPSVGERMSVAVMTFDAAGEMSNFRAFSEGRAEVNSGEQVVKAADAKSESNADAASDVTESAAGDDESSAENKEDDSASGKDSSDEESSDSESSDEE